MTTPTSWINGKSRRERPSPFEALRLPRNPGEWTSGRIQTENYGFKVFAVSSALLNGFSGHFTVQLDQICNIGSLFMVIQVIVGQSVTHNRIFLRKCARWSGIGNVTLLAPMLALSASTG